MSKISHFAVTPLRIGAFTVRAFQGHLPAHMDIIGRYIFRQTASALAMILITLTLIIWMTTALREISLVTNQGQSVVVFLTMTSLTMPNLIAVVAPVALLISCLHTLNRLNGDSELIVLSASGSNVWRVAKPYLALAFIVFAALMAVNAYVLPQSMRVLRDYAVKVRTDLMSQALQPGKFTNAEKGLTIHIAAKDANGDLLSLVIHDERDENEIVTYLAERSEVQKQSEEQAFLIMHTGHILRQDRKTKDVRIITFDSYVFDCSQFGPKEGSRDYKPRERFLSELIYPDKTDQFYKRNQGKFRAELHDRLSGPLYPFLFVMIAIVHLGFPRNTRESRLRDLFTAFGVATLLRILALIAINITANKPAAAVAVWAIPVGGIIVTMLMAHFEIRPLTLPSISFSLPWRFGRHPATEGAKA